MAKIVTVTIDHEGDATVDLAGYKGKGCHVVQQAFERALGKSVRVTKKPEFNQTTVNNKAIAR